MARSLVAKLTIGSGIFLLLLGLLAFMMINNIVSNRAIVLHLSGHILAETQQISAFHLGLERAIVEALTFANEGDEDSSAEAQINLGRAQAALDALQTLTNEQDTDTAPELRTRRQQIQERRRTLLGTVRGSITTVLAGDDPEDLAESFEVLEDSEEVAQALEADSTALHDETIAAIQRNLETRYQRAIYIAPTALVLLTLAVFLGLWWLRRRISQIGRLAQAAGAVAGGDLDQQVPVSGGDEIGTLQTAFNGMVQELRDQQAAIQARNSQLQASLDQQQQLLDTVQQLSTPLLPVGEGIVVLPVVGHVDTRRANEIMQTLLQGVARQRARVAILDITGIAAVDSHVLTLLVQSMRAIELLGALAMLAGISSTMAQIVVEQGLDLGALATFRDLRTAIEAANASLASQAG